MCHESEDRESKMEDGKSHLFRQGQRAASSGATDRSPDASARRPHLNFLCNLNLCRLSPKWFEIMIMIMIRIKKAQPKNVSCAPAQKTGQKSSCAAADGSLYCALF